MDRYVFKRAALAAAKFGLAPAVLYFLCFCVITYPLILHFPTHIFAHNNEGLLQAWNLWWVNKAVTELHESPWFTTYLHFPHGITLLGQARSTLDAFMAIPLLRIMALDQTYNLLLIFHFVASGLTAFLLAYRFTKSYWGSLTAGFLFTFSSYHLSHARGHPELAALEWIPLFLLSWHILLNKPRIAVAITSALVLFLVLLCTPYYFVYCLIAAPFFLASRLLESKDGRSLLTREYASPFLAFFGRALLTAAPLVGAVLIANIRDPFTGSHVPEQHSLDLLGFFIPGAHWRFSELTRPFWSTVSPDIWGGHRHLGVIVIALLVYVWTRRRKLKNQQLGLWFSFVFVFAVLALGPVLHVWGKEVPFIIFPYGLLERMLPPLRLSGTPNRMIMMVSLGAAVISAYAVKLLLTKVRGSRRLVLFPLAALLFLEYLPQPMPSSRIVPPPYLNVLKDLPSTGGVIMDYERDAFPPDREQHACVVLYYQTIHEKPMAFGFITRIPQSVAEKNERIKRLLHQRQYQTLREKYGFSYLLSRTPIEHILLNSVYADRYYSVYVYELAPALEEGRS